MTGSPPTARLPDLELLRRHIEAVWDVRLPPLTPGDVDLLAGSTMPAWAVYLAETASGQVRVWPPTTPIAERPALATRTAAALAASSATQAVDGISREVALWQAERPRLEAQNAARLARLLTPDDAGRLEQFEPQSADYYLAPKCAPAIGVVLDGRLLSVAHSSRRTVHACELGIDTLPEARRRGYALAATVVWAAAVTSLGLLPLYSAFAENTASLALAAAAGYRPFARAAYLILG